MKTVYLMEGEAYELFFISVYYYLYNEKGEMEGREFLRSFLILQCMEVNQGRKRRNRERETGR